MGMLSGRSGLWRRHCSGESVGSQRPIPDPFICAICEICGWIASARCCGHDRRWVPRASGRIKLTRDGLSVLAVVMWLCGCASQGSGPRVKLGIDVLRDSGFVALAGKRVGLVTNPSGVDSRLTSTVDLLSHAKQVQLVELFGPEHGIYGDEYGGATVSDRVD